MRKSSAVKSPAVARRLVVLAFLAAGCGLGQAPHMAVGSECIQGDVTLQLEAGITTACASYLPAVVGYYEEYVAKFGEVGPVTVRMRATNDLRTTGVSEKFVVGGHTYDGAVVDVIQDGTLYVAHEVRHVQLGGGHSGWCVVYAPWSKAVVGWDQDDYLGCH